MKNKENSVIPVANYIMNQFPEPLSIPNTVSYEKMHSILVDFIENRIDFDQCVSEATKFTYIFSPLEQLRTIKNISNEASHNYIRTDSTRRKKFQNWTITENNRLLAGILKFGLDNWTAIAKFVGSKRSRSQCNQRWTRSIDPNLSKSPWTIEETNKLCLLVKQHGDKAWTLISSLMGNRSDVQCRYHYNQISKRNRKRKIHPQYDSMEFINNIELESTIVPDLNVLTDKGSEMKQSSSETTDDMLESSNLFSSKFSGIDDLVDQPEWFFDRNDL